MTMVSSRNEPLARICYPLCLEGLLKVGDDVIDMLDTNADTNEVIRNTDCDTDIFRHANVRHRPRLFDERLNAAKALSQREHLHI